MQKNVASQKAIYFAFDSTTNLPKTGDAANITPYESIDYGAVTAITDTSMTEMDSTNAKGYYICDLTQAETNGNTILFSAKSSTSNIVVVGAPAVVQTVPASFIVAPGSAGAIFVGGSNAATTIAGLTTGAIAATTITASGAVAFQSTFAVTTSTALGALSCTTLTASGAVAFQSTFAVTTSSAFGAMSCTTLTASGAVAFQSTFAVTTSTALGALSCTTFTASGAVALQSTLVITGAVTLSSTLATGAVTLSALTVTNNLLVSGTTTLTGAVSLGSTLGVTGTTTFAAVTTTGTLTLNAMTVTNNLLVSGTTTLTGTVAATGAANDIRGVLLQKLLSAAMDELSGVPAAGPTAGAALQFIFMALRNKRITDSNSDEITNDAGATIATAALSDDTVTFEKGEYA